MVWTNHTKHETAAVDGKRAIRAIGSAKRRAHAIVGVAPIRLAPPTGNLANGDCTLPARCKLRRETWSSAGQQPLPNAWAYGRCSILRRHGRAYARNASGRSTYQTPST